MSTPAPIPLTKGTSVTLASVAGVVTGTATIGPTSRGPGTWNVTGVLVSTTRPGVAPIPNIQIWLDQTNPNGIQGISYDGSFSQGTCDITMVRGQNLIATWTGGLAGDVASITVTGTQQ